MDAGIDEDARVRYDVAQVGFGAVVFVSVLAPDHDRGADAAALDGFRGVLVRGVEAAREGGGARDFVRG